MVRLSEHEQMMLGINSHGRHMFDVSCVCVHIYSCESRDVELKQVQ